MELKCIPRPTRSSSLSLLIELYGIEIKVAYLAQAGKGLLIELYGIEIYIFVNVIGLAYTFNRTIWN